METLLDKIRRSDEDAFYELFRTYSFRLQRFAFEYIGDMDDTMDIVQNIFLSVWEKRETMDAGINPDAYLLTLTKNGCIDHLRKRQIRRQYATETRERLQLEQSLNLDALEALEIDSLNLQDMKRLVNQTLATLPSESREVFLLSRKEQLKYSEIAERLNVSIRTVERRMGLALASLRKSLREFYTLLSFLI